MSRLLRAFRDVLPPRVLVAFVALPMWGFAWLGACLGSDPDEGLIPFMGVLALLHGLWRGLGQHPALPGHKAWLEQTPWAPGRRLPLGPVKLVWQDAVLLVVAGAPALYAGAFTPLVSGLVVFLLTYSCVLGCTFLVTRVPRAVYPLLFALPALLLWPQLLAALGVAVAMAAWTQLCLPASLAGFPWRDDGPLSLELGAVFPYAQLQHDAEYVSVRWYDGLALAALATWWSYALHTTCGVEPGAVLVCVGGASFIRLGIYLHQAAPPISVLGRLRTLRLVIPRFDKVFVAPALACVTACGLLAGLPVLGASLPLTCAVATGVPAALLLLLGPNLEAWRLTGFLRIPAPQHQLLQQQQREKQAQQRRRAAA